MTPTYEDFSDPFYVELELNLLDNLLTFKFRNHVKKS